MKRLLIISAWVIMLVQNHLFAQSNDGLWPSPIISGKDTLIVYPPQFEKWSGNILKGRSAVQYIRSDKDEAFGIVSFTANTETSTARNLVFLSDFKIDECTFPSLSDKGASLKPLLTNQLAEQNTLSVEQINSGLANNQTAKTQTTEVKNDPPHVYYSSSPAVLILVDGDPHKQKTESDKFDRVINTSVFMLYDKEERAYEVSLFGKWFKSSAINDDWILDMNPHKDLKRELKNALMADTSIQTFMPAPQEIGELLDHGWAPKIYASTNPAELIITDGEPKYEPISGTNLLYVTNTNVDLFKYVGDGMDYVLLSGRWFKASNVNAAWSFVPPDQLPSDFKNIPSEHIKSNSLVSVPGTSQAQEAAISSQIPQTATIDRQSASMDAAYDGDPQFQPIGGTNMQYAVNTNTPVILYDNSYYAVTNGVWYNAPSPMGPWVVSVLVPQVIYTIPPSSPIYYVTYVRVYGYTPTVVYMGYTPGYYGCYVNPWGTVVYGTGWRYRPWTGRYWYGNPYSYGVGLSFGWSSWTGWSMGFGYRRAYYPVCRPWWGPVAYGPNRPVFINHTSINVYNYNHGRMVVASHGRNHYRAAGPGNNGHWGNAYHRSYQNHYYPGNNGQVYRHNSNGQWYQNNGNGWQQSNHNNGNQYGNHHSPSSNNNGGNYSHGRNGNHGSHNGNFNGNNGHTNNGNHSSGNNGNHYGNQNGNNGNQYGNQNNQGNSNGNNSGHNGQVNGNNGNHYGNQNGNNGNHYGNQSGNNGNHYGNQNGYGNNSASHNNGNQSNRTGSYSHQNNPHQGNNMNGQSRMNSQPNFNHANAGRPSGNGGSFGGSHGGSHGGGGASHGGGSHGGGGRGGRR